MKILFLTLFLFFTVNAASIKRKKDLSKSKTILNLILEF